MKILVTGILVLSLSGCFATGGSTYVEQYDTSKASQDQFLVARALAACDIIELRHEGPAISSSRILTMAHESRIESLRHKYGLHPSEINRLCNLTLKYKNNPEKLITILRADGY